MIAILAIIPFRRNHISKGRSILAFFAPLTISPDSHTSVMIFLNYERIVGGACLSGNEIDQIIVFLFGGNFNAPVVDDDRFI